MEDRTWLTGAIELNREALLHIAARLFALVRLPCGGMKDTLPAILYYRVLSILRPAESAVRRLVVLEAIGLETEAALPVRDRARSPGPACRKDATSGYRERVPGFQLFDPFKPLPDNPWLEEGDALPRTLTGRMGFVDDAPRDAVALCRRIRALIGALDDLPAQARRLARWQRKRERPRRWSSLRPGFPPGYRKRARHHVEDVLRECMLLVAWAHSPPARRLSANN